MLKNTRIEFTARNKQDSCAGVKFDLTEMVLFDRENSRKTRLPSPGEVCSFPDSFHFRRGV